MVEGEVLRESEEILREKRREERDRRRQQQEAIRSQRAQAAGHIGLGTRMYKS